MWALGISIMEYVYNKAHFNFTPPPESYHANAESKVLLVSIDNFLADFEAKRNIPWLSDDNKKDEIPHKYHFNLQILIKGLIQKDVKHRFTSKQALDFIRTQISELDDVTVDCGKTVKTL
eukprot:TRINITY_DN11227_c0_g1_i1.p1 TRINITY_DN11227_c0_g1~~TRINITY_DN11227_c0_g1_i1.p1  ORF type:complete len:120 (+),score=19.57 TRINITY_DN11227_c0_g1_i1:245-604(+)